MLSSIYNNNDNIKIKIINIHKYKKVHAGIQIYYSVNKLILFTSLKIAFTINNIV